MLLHFLHNAGKPQVLTIPGIAEITSRIVWIQHVLRHLSLQARDVATVDTHHARLAELNLGDLLKLFWAVVPARGVLVQLGLNGRDIEAVGCHAPELSRSIESRVGVDVEIEFAVGGRDAGGDVEGDERVDLGLTLVNMQLLL